MPSPLTPAQLDRRIDAVDWDIADQVNPWHVSDAPAMVWAYRFESAKAADFPWTDVFGLAPFSNGQKAAVREALSEYSAVINLRFVEETGAQDPELSFYRASEGLFGGRGRFDYTFSGDWDGSAVFNTGEPLDASNRYLLIHEIGHTLGLKHTGNYDVGGNLPPPPYLRAAEDNTRFSVMSYNDDPVTGRQIAELGLYDIAALQARFGANLRHATGNNTYSGPENGLLDTIWDAAGIDRLSAKGVTQPVTLDLRPGLFSDFGPRGELAIAYGAEIERAVGGSAADRITGNGGANQLGGAGGGDRIKGLGGADRLLGQAGDDFLFGGAGADRLKDGPGADRVWGNGGRDTFVAGPGDDVYFGGAGTDTLRLPRASDRYDLTENDNGSWQLSGHLGQDTLRGIERIAFADDVLIF